MFCDELQCRKLAAFSVDKSRRDFPSEEYRA